MGGRKPLPSNVVRLRDNPGKRKAGRIDDAARAAADVRRLHPFFEADLYGEAFRDPVERDRIRSSLRKAGL
jgi:hypothetical protein